MEEARVPRGGRVLVVDDEPMVRDTLGQLLTSEGYVVDLAVDGMTALERVRAARPDAILLDLMMPGMNGKQFLKLLRDDPIYARVPVLIMTAVHGVNLPTLDASELVEKPFNVEDLLNKVALAVYRARESSPSQQYPAVAPPPEPVPEKERGVVILCEHDRSRLQQVDLMLSARGYTVVSMTRAIAQLSRLARALRPRAILLDWVSEGVADVVRELDDASGYRQIPILVFSRTGDTNNARTFERATDIDLVDFVERQGDQQLPD
ncbi:MAG TPA: response regulator [Kofleriaceae bacterium]|jgi:DNA-binding response OmpR family regulator|nr:response regulator [Kofleriaceae bacterium]